VTTTDPNASEQKRGRHAKRDDKERTADPESLEREPAHAAAARDPLTPADTDATTARDETPDEHSGDGTEQERTDPDPDRTDQDAPEEVPAAAQAPTAAEARDEGPAVESGAPTHYPVDRPRRAEPPDVVPIEQPKTRSRHSIAHHPAGSSLLTVAGLTTGLALAPLLFDQLRFEVAMRAAGVARSAAAPWPGGGEPWFWPAWVATTALVVAVAVLVLAALGRRLPDVVVLATAVVLAATTARAAWATLDVLNGHLWELVPVCIVCLLAVGSAVAAVFRWRSPDSVDAGSGAGEVAGVTIGAWLLVVLLVLGGSAIASSAETHALGDVAPPPRTVAGLLSVRAADAPRLDDLRGSWVAQVGAAQVGDDAAASAYAVDHRDWTTRLATVLARGDDVGAPGFDDTWWLSLAARSFRSPAEVSAWCTGNGLAGCTPLLVSG
jgi:hypothetical protein